MPYLFSDGKDSTRNSPHRGTLSANGCKVRLWPRARLGRAREAGGALDLRVRWTDRERWRSWVAGTATSPLMAWIDAARVKSMPHGKDTAMLDSADDIGAIPLFSVMFGGVEVSRLGTEQNTVDVDGWVPPRQAL